MKTIDDFALEAFLGEYGIDEETQRKLLDDKYEEVIERLNKLILIAKDVNEGKWGSGWNREQALNGAGYPYSIVQIMAKKLADSKWSEEVDFNGC